MSQEMTSSDIDPLTKFKDLIPRLKASLVNVMRVSGKVFKENSHCDSLSYTGVESAERLDNTLEQFYSLCDQVEMNLKLALECVQQNAESSKFTPVPVSVKPDTQTTGAQTPDTQTFQHYLSIVQTQTSCAKEIHDAFAECSKKITERPLLSSQQMLQQQLQQQQQQAQQQTQQQQQQKQQQNIQPQQPQQGQSQPQQPQQQQPQQQGQSQSQQFY